MNAARLDDLFEAQVRRTPDAVALQLGAERLSYRELNARANRLARVLGARGAGPAVRVGICLERSFDLIAAVLAVVKAGGAYVPLDTRYPRRRIGLMVADAEVGLVLSSRSDEALLPPSCPRVLIEEIATEAAGQPDSDRRRQGTGEDPIYVIFTSGSTGRPKGVLLRHRNVASYVSWAARYYLAGQVLDFALFTPLSFDLTVTSLFVPLVTGGRIVLYPDHPAAPGATLWNVLADNAVDILKLTPSHLALMQHEDLTGSRIRKLIVGGEQLRTDLARALRERFGGAVEIYNEYGPTETTVGSTVHRYDPERDRGPAVPIGRPIDNTSVHLLDRQGRPCAAGVEGEIFIGGAGVAAGYVNSDAETAARFVADPSGGEGRLYATGDIGCRNAEGVLEFRGRSDSQIKLHGFRIEPAEVEAALNLHPDVAQSVVKLRSDPNAGPQLVAWVVASGAGLFPEALLEGVAEQLPPHMVPAAVVVIDEMPLTPNGKIDRAALPAPD